MISFTLRLPYPKGENPCAHWIERWVGARTSLESVEKRKMHAPAGNLTPIPGHPLCSLLTGYQFLRNPKRVPQIIFYVHHLQWIEYIRP
jgi:hypothetical protein